MRDSKRTERDPKDKPTWSLNQCMPPCCYGTLDSMKHQSQDFRKKPPKMNTESSLSGSAPVRSAVHQSAVGGKCCNPSPNTVKLKVLAKRFIPWNPKRSFSNRAVLCIYSFDELRCAALLWVFLADSFCATLQSVHVAASNKTAWWCNLAALLHQRLRPPLNCLSNSLFQPTEAFYQKIYFPFCCTCTNGFSVCIYTRVGVWFWYLTVMQRNSKPSVARWVHIHSHRCTFFLFFTGGFVKISSYTYGGLIFPCLL